MNRVSIQLKILAGIVAVLLLSVSLSIVISVANQRTALLDVSQRDVRITNEILNAVIRNIMLDGEAPLAVSTIEDLQQVPGVDQLQIYRRDGSVAFSDFETLDFVNEFQNFMMFDETPRQEDVPVSQAAFQRSVNSSTPQVVESIEDRRLEFFFPIINTADCRVCHGDDHLVRGVAYYSISLDRVFTQIDRGRNILILFFLGTGAVIAMVLFGLMRRVVISPVRSIGAVVQTVGQGNLDVAADIRTQDEFGLLAGQINTMISGLKDRDRLELENQVIDARNQENQKYLDNIGEGLLLIGPDRKISSQYSAYITRLFGTEEVAGRFLDEFVYPDKSDDSQARQELREFIDVIFESLSTEMDMIMSINPLQDMALMVPDHQGGEKRIVIDAAFYRIMDGESVENVMVIFTDRTGIVEVQEELERERKRSDAELEQIAAVLRIGPRSFAEFSEDAKDLIGRLEQLADGGKPDMNSLSRDLHSLKGTARYLNFAAIGDSIHALEDSLPALTGGGDGEKTFPRELERLKTDIRGIEDIQSRFMDFSRAGGQTGAGSPASSPGGGNLAEFRRAVDRMVAELADEREKVIKTSFRSNLRDFPAFRQLRPLLIHLVRNAVDHGIEERFERISAGKSEHGTLEFLFNGKADGSYKIIVADDGGGIDFSAVRRRAVKAGLIAEGDNPDNAQLTRLLFSSGFSTRETADDLSGRGVGLDAVQDGVAALGGRISVWTEEGRGTHFTITFARSPEIRQGEE